MSAQPSSDRLKRLLEAGYFPAELPPPFTTRPMGAAANLIFGEINQNKAIGWWTSPEAFNVPRWGQMRRKLAIVNPINQLMVSKTIADHWDEISAILKRSRTSEFHPEIVARGGRAVTGVNFDGVQRRRIKLLSTYGRYVKTDIARFYASIYTHSISWAVLGKPYVKKHFSTASFKAHYTSMLDKAVSAGQSGQTVGIPIGPDTSRIISELIACGVEDFARATLGEFDKRCVRFVDDMLLGLRETEAAEAVLSALSAALYEYELELNGEKTSVHGFGSKHAPEWLHFLKRFEFSSSSIDGERDDIDSFFEQAFHLADENPKDNVVRYAVRRSTSFKIRSANMEHFVRCLIYAVRRAPSSLGIVVEYTASLLATGKRLPMDEISSFIHQWIVGRAEAAHTYEVCWLLFWARELKITIDAQALTPVLRLRSSAVALLTLDLRQQHLLNGNISDDFWRQFATADGLSSEMWLAAYEITRKGWWTKRRSVSFIDKHEYFGPLHRADVYFYDTAKHARSRTGSDFLALFATRASKPSEYDEIDDDEDPNDDDSYGSEYW